MLVVFFVYNLDFYLLTLIVQLLTKFKCNSKLNCTKICMKVNGSSI